MAHLTPHRFQLETPDAEIEVPRWRYDLNRFFHDQHPARWLVEQFADAMGGDDCSEFLAGISVAAKKKWRLSAHFNSLHVYYLSEAGKVQIIVIQQRTITEKKRINAHEKTLGDLYDGIASSSNQVMSQWFIVKNVNCVIQDDGVNTGDRPIVLASRYNKGLL